MTLKEQIKQILIEDLNLEDITAEEIADDEPLFGEGLGLDLQSVQALAQFIEDKQGK
ncbi:MAG: hypothetical protein JRG71_14455 [Deltaproteobacteria bacterium]|nr:hypothetical protein [Deltaproteobacteria bacterium]